MRKVVFSILLIVASFGNVTQAQVPGYIGRKNVIRVDFNFFPASPYKFSKPNNYTGKEGFYLNGHKGFGYERVVSRRHVLGLDLDLTRFGSQNVYHLNQYGITKTTALGFGFHFKAFPFLKKGWLAPLGPYFGLAFRFINVNSRFFSSPSFVNGIDYENHQCGSTALLFGYSTLIKERLLLDFGMRWAFTDLYHAHINDNASSESRNGKILFAQDIMKIHLGLGFLF